ncbi:protein of unknown function [Paraburkholderia dioscoreae]|uniref:Uncharacterized protein n=1 Tax=Paraburkholderia dioscoreae TaxID=2604047 RepID=A0A5Q4Z2Y8_9BURK|nr:protein of unknown function [Paraburkholderia dioscoreae]
MVQFIVTFEEPREMSVFGFEAGNQVAKFGEHSTLLFWITGERSRLSWVSVSPDGMLNLDSCQGAIGRARRR